MRVDRWNCGSLRRYHFPNGAIAIALSRDQGGRCAVAPPAVSHVFVDIAREMLADELRKSRATKRSET